VVTQVNSARAQMHGVNAAPLPHGDVTVRPDGALHIQASGGRQYGVRPNGSISSFSSPTHAAQFRPDGHLATLHSGGLRVSHPLAGGRIVHFERPDRSVVVSFGPHRGYVQRPVMFHNAAYVQRTYVVGNVVYTRTYRPYRYGGVEVSWYLPSAYYAPAYYGWVASPWRAPVRWRWGWEASPWYGYYGGYFSPLPVYPSPAIWLADYIVAEQLQAAYQARAAAAQEQAAAASEAAAAQTAPITPEVRAAIAEEVQRQLAEERAASERASAAPGAGGPDAPLPQGAVATELPPEGADPALVSAGAPPVIQRAGRVLVVSSPLEVAVDDQSCELSPGDVLRLDAVPEPGQPAASVRVLSSRGQDCTAGAVATLSVVDLQEMLNDFHERVDSGLANLKTNQGSGSMPPAPAGSMATRQGPGAVGAPSTDDAVAAVDATQRNADSTEAQLQQELSASSGATAPN
jgi:hypothetical protein